MLRANERLHYFNPSEDIEVHHHVVPHWEQDAVTYFVTFRLADSIPRLKLEQWKREKEAWLSFHPQPWKQETELEYHRRFSSALERWLDQNHGSCILQKPECMSIVAGVLQYFDDVRYIQHAFVIMPMYCLPQWVSTHWTAFSIHGKALRPKRSTRYLNEAAKYGRGPILTGSFVMKNISETVSAISGTILKKQNSLWRDVSIMSLVG